MAIEKDWEERLRAIRPIFEVIGFALTTFTWISLCAVGTFMVLRGYTTLAPPLVAMGWQGVMLYSFMAVPFTLIAVISSLIVFLALWSLIVHLKWDLELGSNSLVAFLVGVFGGLWHFGFAMFILLLIIVLAGQIIATLGP